MSIYGLNERDIDRLKSMLRAYEQGEFRGGIALPRDSNIPIGSYVARITEEVTARDGATAGSGKAKIHDGALTAKAKILDVFNLMETVYPVDTYCILARDAIKGRYFVLSLTAEPATHAGIYAANGISGVYVTFGDSMPAAGGATSSSANNELTCGASGAYEMHAEVSWQETSNDGVVRLTISFDLNGSSSGVPLAVDQAEKLGRGHCSLHRIQRLTSGTIVKLRGTFGGPFGNTGTGSIVGGTLSIKRIGPWSDFD